MTPTSTRKLISGDARRPAERIRVSVYIKRPPWWAVWRQPDLFIYADRKWWWLGPTGPVRYPRQRFSLPEGFHIKVSSAQWPRIKANLEQPYNPEPFYFVKLLVAATGRPLAPRPLKSASQAWQFLCDIYETTKHT